MSEILEDIKDMGVLIGKGGVYGQVGGVTMSWPILVSVYSHVVEKEKKFTWLHAKNKITLTATNQIHFIYWSVLSVNLSIKAEDSSGWRGTQQQEQYSTTLQRNQSYRRCRLQSACWSSWQYNYKKPVGLPGERTWQHRLGLQRCI